MRWEQIVCSEEGEKEEKIGTRFFQSISEINSTCFLELRTQARSSLCDTQVPPILMKIQKSAGKVYMELGRASHWHQ